MNWNTQKSAQLRKFLDKVEERDFKELLENNCPATITVKDIMDKDADAVSRLAAFKAGWDACSKFILDTAKPVHEQDESSGHQSMD